MLTRDDKTENPAPKMEAKHYMELIAQGQALVEKQRFEPAIALFDYASNARPDLISAYFYRAQTYATMSVQKNQTELETHANQAKAFAAYMRTIELLESNSNPNVSMAERYLAFAQCYEGLGKIKATSISTSNKENSPGYDERLKARDYYSKIIELHSKDWDAFSKRAMLNEKLNKKEEYLSDLSFAKKYRQEENSFRLWYHHQLRHYLKKKIFYFTSSLQLVTATDIQDSKLTNGASTSAFLGYNAFQENNYDLAITLFNRAISFFRDDFISRTYRGMAYYRIGKKEEAFSDFATVISNYNYARAHLFRGMIHFYEHEIERAKIDFMTCIPLCDETDFGLLDPIADDILSVIDNQNFLVEEKPNVSLSETIRQGEEKFAEKDYLQALTYFNQALQLDKKNSSLYDKIGQCYLNLENEYKAELYYSIAIWLAKPQESSEPYFHRALIHIRADRIDRVGSDIRFAVNQLCELPKEKAIKIASEANKVYYDAYVINILKHLSENDIETAQKYFDAATKIDNNKDLYDTFAEICVDRARSEIKKNNLDIAEIFLEEAIKKRPTVELYIEHGHVLRQLKRYMPACEARDRALELNFGNLALHYKIKQLTDQLRSDVENDNNLAKAMSHQTAEAKKIAEEKSTKDSKQDEVTTSQPESNKKPKKKKHKKAIITYLTKRKHTAHHAHIKNTIEEDVQTESNNDTLTNEIVAESKKIADEKEAWEREKEKKDRVKEKEKQKKAEKVRLRRARQQLTSVISSNQEKQVVNESAAAVATNSDTFSDSSKHPSASLSNSSTLFLMNQLAIKPERNDEAPELTLDTLSITLTDIERDIFNKFSAFNKTAGTDYRTFSTGTSIYSRGRDKISKNQSTHKILTYEFVTEISRSDIINIFKTVDNVNRIEDVDGKFKIDIGNNITLVFEHCDNLSHLIAHAKNRSFRDFYLDAAGKVYDPTGFAMAEMLKNQPKTNLLIANIFKQNPTAIFEALYRATKYDNTIANPLQQQFKRELQKDENAIITLFDSISPDKLNDSLCLAFSEGMASKNYEKLRELGLLRILFPSLNDSLEKDHAWLISQMQITDNFAKPIAQRIYSSFIISTVMQQRRSNMNAYDQITILNHSRHIINNSKWLQHAFPINSDLSPYLAPAIKHWNQSHPITTNQNTFTTQEVHEPISRLGRP